MRVRHNQDTYSLDAGLAAGLGVRATVESLEGERGRRRNVRAVLLQEGLWINVGQLFCVRKLEPLGAPSDRSCWRTDR